jgi:Xaa-Pro aminopeptidase
MAAAPESLMNRPRLKTKMEQAGLDAIILASPENFFYTTGALILTMRTLRDRLAFSVLTPSGDALAVVCGIEESLTKHDSWIKDIRPYVERKDDPATVLAAALREKGWDRLRLGYESRFLPVAHFERLRLALPGATLVPADDVIISTRAVKTQAEVERVRHAAQVTERAIADAFAAARPGHTEKSVNDRIMTNLLSMGADSVLFSVFGTGANGLHPHAIPGEAPLTPGEVGRVDSGGEFKGYTSDLARSMGTGQVPEYTRDAYKHLRDIERETIAFLRPGRTAAEVFEYCKNAYAKHRLPFIMPHIGHGIPVLGGEMHEEPNLHPFNSTPIEAGMIFNIEPFVWDWERGFALHIEDAALVTESGSVILSDAIPTDEMFIVR